MQAALVSTNYGSLLDNDDLLYRDCKCIGELSLTQLAELRHRGAFSTVAQTFTTCCLTCAASENRKVANLPRQWYRQTLDSIQVKASALTRRSAGLPSMVTSILVAYPHSEFLDSSIFDLQKIACMPASQDWQYEKTRLPQVHALNCLKDIFTNTRLGSSTEKHLDKTFKIATDCLSHEMYVAKSAVLVAIEPY